MKWKPHNKVVTVSYVLTQHQAHSHELLQISNSTMCWRWYPWARPDAPSNDLKGIYATIGGGPNAGNWLLEDSFKLKCMNYTPNVHRQESCCAMEHTNVQNVCIFSISIWNKCTIQIGKLNVMLNFKRKDYKKLFLKRQGKNTHIMLRYKCVNSPPSVISWWNKIKCNKTCINPCTVKIWQSCFVTHWQQHTSMKQALFICGLYCT